MGKENGPQLEGIFLNKLAKDETDSRTTTNEIFINSIN